MKSPIVPAGEARAVIFDLDGTLLDSIPDTQAALNKILCEDGLRSLSLDEVRNLVGNGAISMLRRARALVDGDIADIDLDRLQKRYLDAYLSDPTGHTIVYPGVFEILDQLRAAGLMLAICTNKPKISTHVVLDSLGLSQFFSTVLCPEDVEFTKPDGRHLTATLTQLGCSRAGAIFVGDSETDMAAAADAGIFSVLVSWGYGRSIGTEASPSAIIDQFSELPAVLTRHWQHRLIGKS